MILLALLGIFDAWSVALIVFKDTITRRTFERKRI